MNIYWIKSRFYKAKRNEILPEEFKNYNDFYDFFVVEMNLKSNEQLNRTDNKKPLSKDNFHITKPSFKNRISHVGLKGEKTNLSRFGAIRKIKSILKYRRYYRYVEIFTRTMVFRIPLKIWKDEYLDMNLSFVYTSFEKKAVVSQILFN